MAELPAGLLEDVKSYLKITWQDDGTDSLIIGYISRGMKRLQDIAGASLDFMAEDSPRQLLFDYCRYANSQALEVFEKNFEADLLEMNLRYQAPIIDNLVVILTPSSDGVLVAIAPDPNEENGYVYQVGTDLTLPGRLETCVPGGEWVEWYGEVIMAEPGQEIMVTEVNREYGAERAGKATV